MEKIILGNGKEIFYNDEQFETYKKVQVLFKNEKGDQMYLTPTQCDVFNDIFKRRHKQIHLMAHTRFGKSMTVAMAVLTRITTYPEKWCILAPTKEKARIIMDYIIQHSFDNEYFKGKLIIEKGESVEALRRKRSKDRINFVHSDGTLGEVFIIGVDSNNSNKAGDAAMGFGAANIILDEAALVDDEIESKIFRMLGDNADDYFYCKIGNPFKRNHFLKDYRNTSIFHRNITSELGVREGRLNEEFLNIAKTKPNYDVLFENKFPPANMVDKDGWTSLLTEDEIEKAMVDGKVEMFGEKRLGLDPAGGGGCFNSYVLRSENFAALVRKDEEDNTMTTVGNMIQIARRLEVPQDNIFMDKIGLGRGIHDRCREQSIPVKGINVAESAIEKLNYFNLRAEGYWNLRKWIKAGGKLKKHSDWYELENIKYKAQDSTGKMIIMSKEEMRKRGINSPDTADALMLTFTTPNTLRVKKFVRNRIKRIRKDQNKSYNMKMA